MNEIFTELSLKSRIKQAIDKKTLVITLFAVILLIFYLNSISPDLEVIVDIIASIDFLLLLFGVSWSIIALFFDSVAWRELLKSSKIVVSYWKAFKVFMSSWTFNLLIPSAGASEIAVRTALTKSEFANEDKNQDLSPGNVLPSIILHRLLGMLAFIPLSAFVAYGLASIGYFGLNPSIGWTFMIIVSLVYFIITLTVISIAIKPAIVSTVVGVLCKIPGKVITGLKEPMEKINLAIDQNILTFSQQFQALARNRLSSMIAYAATFCAAVSHWISIYFIVSSIGIGQGENQFLIFHTIAVIAFVAGTIELVPVTFAGMEALLAIANTSFYSVIPPNSSEHALVAALLIRLVKFYFIVFIGILMFATRQKRSVVADEFGQHENTDMGLRSSTATDISSKTGTKPRSE
ncbi:MAG: YbhN family protein [Candidatus Odinarchaeota archaeon]